MPPPTDAQKRLTAALDASRRLAMGPPLNIPTDADVTVGPEDVALAEALARDSAGRLAVDLFRARRG